MAASDNDFQLPAGRLLGGCPNFTHGFHHRRAKNQCRSQTSGANQQFPSRYSHLATCFSWIRLTASLYQVRGRRSIRPSGRNPSPGAFTFMSHYQANVYGIFCIRENGNCLYYPRLLGCGCGASRELRGHEKHGRSKSQRAQMDNALL
jgi:hypothetical protein